MAQRNSWGLPPLSEGWQSDCFQFRGKSGNKDCNELEADPHQSFIHFFFFLKKNKKNKEEKRKEKKTLLKMKTQTFVFQRC